MARKKAATTAPVTRPTTDISSIIDSLGPMEMLSLRSMVGDRLLNAAIAQLDGKTVEELTELAAELAKRMA